MKNIVKLATLAALGLSHTAYAEPTPPPPNLDAICAEGGCRLGEYEAVIAVEGKEYLTVPVGRSPYVMEDDSILIFPGETIAIQFTPDGDKLTHPKFLARFAPELPVQIIAKGRPMDNPADAIFPGLKGKLGRDKIANLPSNLLLISYGQDKARKTGMMLTLDQNFSKTLKLKAIMMIIERSAYNPVPTSTCAIAPRITNYEYWPHPVGPMILRDFHFIKTDGTLPCE